MALSDKSLFTYGLTVTASNSSLDFKIASGGPEKRATLNQGYYSPDGLCTEVARALQVADPNNFYSVTCIRSVGFNRVNILTSGSFLSLLFASGSRNASSCASLLGFPNTDRTGATSYTGGQSIGTILIPSMIGYNFLPPEALQTIQGSKLVSTSGRKESIVFQIMEFIQIQFKYEPKSRLGEWNSFFRWAIQQRPLELIPEISTPSVYYDCTLEKTSKDANGMGFQMTELLPQYPNFYDTGSLQFRKNISTGSFILP